ncbi:MAG: BON domain-containing protein [Acidobacteriaceae bacterium]
MPFGKMPLGKMLFGKLLIAPTLAATFLFASASALPGVAQTAAKAAPANTAQDDAKLQTEVQKKLKGSRFKDVHVSVQNGIATLSGPVKIYDDKQQAEKKVAKTKGLTSVVNDIEVAAGETSDQQLQDKLRKQLAYDRVGYGNAFNAIDVSVQNGVATLSGHALGPVAKSSALSLASHTPGITNVVDHIQVDPLSPFDNETRIRVARAVYGYPSLNKYAIDPANPIRITVVNGHVILSGVVLNQSDKDVAGIQANGVPGVFSVTNNLQVANSSSERK